MRVQASAVLKKMLRPVIGFSIRVLPESLLVALLPRRYRYSSADVTSPPKPDARAVRLLVAPVNWAGQADRWASAAREHLPDVAAVSMAYRVGREFGHPVDQTVPIGAYVVSRAWQRAQREVVLTNYTHVLIEALRPPFGAVFSENVADQVRDLQAAGVRVALVCHGSDIRLPSRHASRNPDSPFQGSLLPNTASLEREAAANRRILDKLGLPVFVSTPDLLIDVPSALWIPVVIDTQAWGAGGAVLERHVPVVLHAPSGAVMKGSDLIDAGMRRLHDEGVIEYRRLERVPAHEMIDAVRSADIVLEQFRLGSFGVAAVEALATGRLVVGAVTDQVRDHVRAETGLDLPIVHSTAADVPAVVRDLVARRAASQRHAALGRDYAVSVHDGRRSAAVLAQFLGERRPLAR